MSNSKYPTTAERTALRRQLRKEFKAGNLEARRTYYDYYDSCHPPIETPDAPWMPIGPELGFNSILLETHLKAGGPSIKIDENGQIELFTGYANWQLRLKGGSK